MRKKKLPKSFSRSSLPPTLFANENLDITLTSPSFLAASCPTASCGTKLDHGVLGNGYCCLYAHSHVLNEA